MSEPTSQKPSTDAGRERRLFRRFGRAIRRLDVRRHQELALFPSEQQSRKAMRRAARRLIRRPVFVVAVAGAVGLSLTSTLLLRRLVASLGLPIGQVTRNLILAVPVVALCCALVLWFLNRHLSKLLRYELLDCGVPICVRCGYHLIGLPGPECPECGRPFDARVKGILGGDAPKRAPR